jgi:hypothetical protein
VDPIAGPVSGGQRVTITGENLSYNDLTSVTLAGTAVRSIVTQNETTLVVESGSRLGAPGSGDVVAESARGTATLTSAYTYLDSTCRCTKPGVEWN